jgi:uncharacterized protein (DUF427 family)
MLYCSQFLKGVAHGASNFEQRTIADSDKFIVIENNCYFPAEAVHFELLREHAGYHTECPWKGTATYCDVIVDGQTSPDAAWSYLEPKPKAQNIAGYVAFWKGVRVKTSATLSRPGLIRIVKAPSQDGPLCSSTSRLT